MPETIAFFGDKIDPVVRARAVQGLETEAHLATAYSNGNAFDVVSSNKYRPMFMGFYSTPWDGPVALRPYHLTGKPEYLVTGLRACQFSSGANPDNLVFTTGLGSNPVQHPLRLDPRSTGQAAPEGRLMKIKAIITGATGMVGEGVLLECLNHPDVEQVLVINRRPEGVFHAKLREIIHADFFDLAPIEPQLLGYDACFFCLGVSSVGMKQDEYKRLTYDLTLNAAQFMAKLNPEMTFCYVTGAGTDGSEQGRVAWARVKGATENALMRLFKQSYMFRPAFMKATPGQKNVKGYYKFFAWLYPLGRALYPAGFCTLQEVGRAMITAATKGYAKRILEVKDIVELAKA